MQVSHATEVTSDVRADGDIGGVVVSLTTGSDTVASQDRHRFTIEHGLKRVPVGVQVIYSDNYVKMKTISRDINQVIVQFDTAEVEVNLRIW